MTKGLFTTNKKGFSLIEVILAVAIFGLIAASLTSISLGGGAALVQGADQTEATALAQEGIEAVMSIRDNAWNEFVFSASSVSVSGSEWVFDGEGTTETIGNFTRTISFEDICRDGSDSITDCPGVYIDPHTQLVVSTVTWTSVTGVENEVVKRAIVSNWDGGDWIQTDWSGGSGQTIWSDTTAYDSDDGDSYTSVAGQLTLAPTVGGACGEQVWDFDVPGDYTYNPSDIEVTGDVAQLVSSGGSSASGTTLNPDFTSDSANWTYTDWEEGGSSVSGTHNASGGNPTGYIDIAIEKRKNDTLSGHWEQSFTTTVDNPTTATTTFDWSAISYSSSFLSSYQLYVFVDSVSGDPTIGQEVWSSGEITGTTSWVSVPEIDISSELGVAGAYYVKVAMRVITTGGGGPANGTNTAGFDNVEVYWEGSSSGSYPTDEPTINPTSPLSVGSVDNWSSFTEVATKNGGEVYYQLSDDAGSTWQYWTGSGWGTAGPADYNIATDINTNIGTFSTSTSQIMFKAFLESDGGQLVQLDSVTINCSQNQNWPFSSGSNYTYNPSDIEVTGDVAQLVSSGGSSASGTTLNPDFTSDSANWTYTDWEEGGSSVSGTHNASGGNPTGYIDIAIEKRKNDTLSGHWEQSFTTTVDNPTTATTTFDWSAISYSSSFLSSYQLYVFVDSVSGDPTIGQEVWSSGEITGTTSWVSVPEIDISSELGVAGAYYVKVAMRVITTGGGGPANGTNTAGFDNVEVYWEGSSSGSYPTDEPTINPTSPLSVGSVDNWSSFTEVATKNGGEVYYQLSDDAGSTWQYWTGSGWGTAGPADYNIATDINTNIGTFSTSTSQIMFKAFLESDGGQLVSLDNIEISYSQSGGGGGGGGYETSTVLTSSAFDTGNASVFQVVEWDETIPACSPSCTIKFEVSGAPDSGGSPGVWSSWYGSGGTGTFFASSTGALVPTDLNDSQWIRYRVTLNGDGSDTPVLEEVRVNYK